RWRGCIVDEDVNATEGCLREGNESSSLRVSAYVRPEERRTASGAFDHPRSIVTAGLIGVTHDDAGTSSGETNRNGATASGAASSGDDDDSRVVESDRHNYVRFRVRCRNRAHDLPFTSGRLSPSL